MKLTTKIHTYTALSFLALGAISPVSEAKKGAFIPPSADEVNRLNWQRSAVHPLPFWTAQYAQPDGVIWALRASTEDPHQLHPTRATDGELTLDRHDRRLTAWYVPFDPESNNSIWAHINLPNNVYRDCHIVDERYFECTLR
jgi:hypothetical protein